MSFSQYWPCIYLVFMGWTPNSQCHNNNCLILVSLTHPVLFVSLLVRLHWIFQGSWEIRLLPALTPSLSLMLVYIFLIWNLLHVPRQFDPLICRPSSSSSFYFNFSICQYRGPRVCPQAPPILYNTAFITQPAGAGHKWKTGNVTAENRGDLKKRKKEIRRSMGLKRKPTLHYKLSVITWAEEVGGGSACRGWTEHKRRREEKKNGMKSKAIKSKLKVIGDWLDEKMSSP